jgi:WD40 repeat protein
VRSPDAKFLALYGFKDTDVCILELQSGQLRARLQRTDGQSVYYVSFRSDNRQVVLCDEGRNIELWDLDNCTCMWKSQVLEAPNISCVEFSPQKDLVAWAGPGEFGLLDAISGCTIVEPRRFHGAGSVRPYVAWAVDGTQLLTAGWFNGIVCLWDMTLARSSKQVNLLYQWDTSHRTTYCVFFDYHRGIIADHVLFPIPPQYRPACAADDLVPTSLESLLRLR